MANRKISQFTDGGAPEGTDYVGGYDEAGVAGGNKRWSFANIATYVSTALGLGTMATQDADDVDITGGSISGTTIDLLTTAENITLKESYTATGSIAEGDLVAITGDTSATRASADDVPANGVSLVTASGGGAELMNIMNGSLHSGVITAGSPVYLGLNGAITQSVPNTPGRLKQRVGMGVKTNIWQMSIEEAEYIDGSTLSVVDDRIDWDTDITKNANVTISSDTYLDAPSSLEAGGKYSIVITSSAGAQLIFNPVYKFNITGYPVLVDGVTVLTFRSNGTNMYCTSVNTGYEDFSPIDDSNPNTWYAARLPASYSGSTSNVTGVNDFGSNVINATKQGTGNILITDNALNSQPAFDFGSANTDRSFTFGTPVVGSFMTGGAMTIMTVFEPSNTDDTKQVIFGWQTASDDFYLSYNPFTGEVEAYIFDNIGGGALITGSVPDPEAVNIITWVKNTAGDSYLYCNGAQIANGAQTQTVQGSASECLFGSLSVGGLTAFSGNIGDLIIWASALDTATRQDCELELKSVYGVV